MYKWSTALDSNLDIVDPDHKHAKLRLFVELVEYVSWNTGGVFMFQQVDVLRHGFMSLDSEIIGTWLLLCQCSLAL